MNCSTKTVRFPLAALAAASVALPLQAQPTDPYGGNQAVPATTYDAPGAVNTGQFEISAGAEVVSVYMFRGFELQDDGLIVQPYLEVTTDLGDTGFDLTAGTWHSFGTDKDGSGDTAPKGWLEADFYIGTSYELDQFTLGAMLTGYYSPGGFAGDVEEIAFTAQYDDSAYLEEWAVNPYATLVFEIRDANGSEDIYLELGGELAVPFVDSEDLPVELSFPFALGFSIDDYYTDGGGDNEVFGFLKLGAQAAMDLDMIPSDYGVWTGHVGLDLWFVNDDAGLLDNGDGFQPVLRAGVSMTY